MTTYGDFHIHTSYCPHGSNDRATDYIEQAIQQGLQEISFTEHAPLPVHFTDPTPEKDSAMDWKDIDAYIEEIQKLKKHYQHKIKINLGFEIDFIQGYEEETRRFLQTYGPIMDDAILSVHMLQTPNDHYVCIDFSRSNFEWIVQEFGSVDQVYQTYYQTLKHAIKADLGMYKPKRIGHITLIEKYRQSFPPQMSYEKTIEDILYVIRQNHLTLDMNTAGLYKEDCGNMYPPIHIIHQAQNLGIGIYPGSDSHESAHIARGFEHLPTNHT
ncbi:histidinol-phosphatase [Gracilibacillus halophilus YIM-C55.5]|uniref:Histidinol-phosphatase n=1 Tax=Gracilibacillus halophilus YIM-C55.5 TaxID=1308866 RepID=N4WV67_9BACI|nr:histidinol-phosphatase HisJ [Gracilibacillus halophilus]ENH96981.1 histidinol-phosphatase [Gracilibacillus halophilus YIM-C55.5]